MKIKNNLDIKSLLKKKTFADIDLGAIFYIEGEYDVFVKYLYNIGDGTFYSKLGIKDDQIVYVPNISIQDILDNRDLFETDKEHFKKIEDVALHNIDNNISLIKVRIDASFLLLNKMIKEEMELNNINIQEFLKDETRVDRFLNGNKIKKYIDEYKKGE